MDYLRFMRFRTILITGITTLPALISYKRSLKGMICRVISPVISGHNYPMNPLDKIHECVVFTYPLYSQVVLILTPITYRDPITGPYERLSHMK